MPSDADCKTYNLTSASTMLIVSRGSRHCTCSDYFLPLFPAKVCPVSVRCLRTHVFCTSIPSSSLLPWPPRSDRSMGQERADHTTPSQHLASSPFSGPQPVVAYLYPWSKLWNRWADLTPSPVSIGLLPDVFTSTRALSTFGVLLHNPAISQGESFFLS